MVRERKKVYLIQAKNKWNGKDRMGVLNLLASIRILRRILRPLISLISMLSLVRSKVHSCVLRSESVGILVDVFLMLETQMLNYIVLARESF